MACSEYSDRMIPLHRKSGVRRCCDASGDTVDSKTSVLAAALRNFHRCWCCLRVVAVWSHTGDFDIDRGQLGCRGILRCGGVHDKASPFGAEIGTDVGLCVYVLTECMVAGGILTCVRAGKCDCGMLRVGSPGVFVRKVV